MIRFLFRYYILVGIVMLTPFIPHILLDNFFSRNELFQYGQVIGYLSMIASMLFIILGVKSYRDKVLKGKINFKQAFLIGLNISVIGGIIVGLFTIIFVEFVDPTWNESYKAYSIEMIENNPELNRIEKDKEIENTILNLENMQSSPIQGLLMSITVFIIGLFISIINAVVINRKTSGKIV